MEAISWNKNYRINAISDELNNLYSNMIITFVSKDIISTKWVFTTKRDSDSNNFIYKYKAHLIAQVSIKNEVFIMSYLFSYFKY